MKVKEMKMEIGLPEGVEVKVEGTAITAKGKEGEVRRIFRHPNLIIKIEDNKLILIVKNATKRDKTMLGTFESHILNMLAGVSKKHAYSLKICSGHFPMNVSVSGAQFIIKNFLGEKIPRVLGISKGVDVKVDGQMVNVTGIDKELVGQCAASIEQLTRIRNRDTRIFQDGVYIINKAGKNVK